MNIATHSGTFHADDVCAIAVLQLAGVLTSLIRTRDTAELQACDMRVDVGRRYDPATGDFDHHQPEGAGVRPNGVPYASFGLIWREYGVQLAGSTEAAALVDERLVQVIDAEDAGYDLFTARISSVRPYSISAFLGSFNPLWLTEPTGAAMDASFWEAVEAAKGLIRRESAAATAQLAARAQVHLALQQSTDPRLVILERYMPWKQTIITEAPAVLYAVYPVWPKARGQWAVEAVNQTLDSFTARKPLPASWAGKTDIDLATVSGVSDAVFCHSARFLAIAGSRNGALKLAAQALAA